LGELIPFEQRRLVDVDRLISTNTRTIVFMISPIQAIARAIPYIGPMIRFMSQPDSSYCAGDTLDWLDDITIAALDPYLWPEHKA
jgi:hypothetical protein